MGDFLWKMFSRTHPYHKLISFFVDNRTIQEENNKVPSLAYTCARSEMSLKELETQLEFQYNVLCFLENIKRCTIKSQLIWSKWHMTGCFLCITSSLLWKSKNYLVLKDPHLVLYMARGVY